MVPLSKERLPLVRVIDVISIALVLPVSVSLILISPIPVLTVMPPIIFSRASVIGPPVISNAPSAIEITPDWVIDLDPALRVNPPEVRVTAFTAIESASVMLTLPIPVLTVISPNILSLVKVIAPPVIVTVPSSIEITPVPATAWSIGAVPLFKVRSPLARAIDAISIPLVSASVILIFPFPVSTVITPAILLLVRVIAPPVRFKAPSSIKIIPVWSIALATLFKVRSPSVRVTETISIPFATSASVMLTLPLPEATVIAPTTLS